MKNDIMVFDFETGGLDCKKHEPVSIGAKVYNGKTLEPYPEESGEFYSLMKPVNFDNLDPKAMAVNKITRQELEKAPDQQLVIKNFVEWAKQFNPKSGARTAPVAAGKNVPFDKGFLDEALNRWYKKPPIIMNFDNKSIIDLERQWFQWFENESDPPDQRMDTLRPWLGLETDGAHNALVDCRQTGAVIMRILQLHRNLQKKINSKGEKMLQFKGSFAGMGI